MWIGELATLRQDFLTGLPHLLYSSDVIRQNMAKDIKIKLNLSKYTAPTNDDINAAKQYILQREEYAQVLEEKVDGELEDAAARIVAICYRYNVDPQQLVFSSSYNEDMMDEISDVMDEIEGEIYDQIFEYSTQATNNKSIMSALALWMATLGRGNRNLRDTLDGYLFKFMKDIEASVAAYRFMGVSQTDAVAKIRSNLHNIYNQPEVLTAFRRRQDFNATYIRLGGVQPGAVGISNNGSTNVISMSRITLQMAWMRAQAMEWEEDDSISGYYQLRGNSYLCDICDEEVGFHPNIEEIYEKSYPHSHCLCFRVPIHSLEDLLAVKNGDRTFNTTLVNNQNSKNIISEETNDNIITDNFKERRKEITQIALSSLRNREYSNKDVSWKATISGAGIREWINQPHKHIVEKNEAFLNIKELFYNSDYIDDIKDDKDRESVVTSHIFKTSIAGDDSWIIVHEMDWKEYQLYSIADKNPIK